MAPLVKACQGWFRRNLAWCSRRETWQETLGFLGLGAAALGLWGLGRRLAPAQQVVLWGLFGLVAAVLLRRGWLRLLGPILFFDLVRVARRRRYFLLRGLYVVFLALLVGWMYLVASAEAGPGQGRLQPTDMARFAEGFFYTFLTVQFALLTFLTPAYVAGAVAEEKERRTLEFLLATDLRNREIILSKLLSRLANLTLLIFAGLPVLSFLQFLGGVDPNLVFAGFAGTGVTIWSLAGLSIFNSVLTRRARDAIALTYLEALAYLALSGASWLLLAPSLGLAGFPATDTWASPVTLQDLVTWINLGNPFSVVANLAANVDKLASILPTAIRNYALFHGGVGLACSGWAILRLRAIALKQSYGKAQRVSLRRRFWRRPGVGNYPMLWKEIFAEPGLRLNVPARIVVVLLFLASLVPVGFILNDFWSQYQGRGLGSGGPWQQDAYTELAQAMNIWVRLVGTAVACLLLLAVAARAASSLSGERDRQTLDGLLTTPLGSDTILFAKWLGNILGLRWAWLWLALIYGLGLATGGLDVLALPGLVLAWLTYAAVLSVMGLWFSLTSRTTLRATVLTLLTAVGAGVGHWLLWICCLPVFVFQAGDAPAFKWWLDFQVGFTPPAVFAYALPFAPQDLARTMGQPGEALEVIGFALLGLFCWAVIGVVLWGATSARFRVLSGRLPRRPMGAGGPVAARRP